MLVVVTISDGTVFVAADHTTHILFTIDLTDRVGIVQRAGEACVVTLLSDKTTHIFHACDTTGIHTVIDVTLVSTNKSAHIVLSLHITEVDTIVHYVVVKVICVSPDAAHIVAALHITGIDTRMQSYRPIGVTIHTYDATHMVAAFHIACIREKVAWTMAFPSNDTTHIILAFHSSAV